MKISEALIVWTPNRDLFPPGFRGRVRIFPAQTPEEHVVPFARRAGACDARAHDGRLEVRQAYALMIFNVLVLRDGLDPLPLHKALLAVDEYFSACAEASLPEGAPR